jgi:hypothetical protein
MTQPTCWMARWIGVFVQRPMSPQLVVVGDFCGLGSRRGLPDVRFALVSSIGQCNTSCSLLAGVSKAKVFRGR